jgi:hypothetical protein
MYAYHPVAAQQGDWCFSLHKLHVPVFGILDTTNTFHPLEAIVHIHGSVVL